MAIGFDVLRRGCFSIMAAFLMMVAVLGAPLKGHAQEQRCSELGANCICSEPMNTSEFALPSGSGDFGIGFPDSGTKKCAYLGIANTVGEIPSASRSKYAQSNIASVVRALSSTGTPNYVFSGLEGNTGALLLGHTPLPASNHARVALRWYRYYSPNFEFGISGASGGCANSGKEAVWDMPGSPTNVGGVITVSGTQAGKAVYSWAGFTPSPDCCDIAPGYDAGGALVNWTSVLGRWFRMEYVINNTAGPSLTFEFYMTDVTQGVPRLNNGNEMRIANSSQACGSARYPSGCGGTTTGWTSAMATSLQPPVPIRAINIDGFRRDVCAGFAAYSHLMAASWTTNAGQRIGAAREIEGAQGTASAPLPPGILTVK
jgi:hypothetical protein